MGAIQHEETHVKRSSSMSFALRWKHGNVRMICIAALISSAMAFMFFMLWYGTAYKSVSLVVDGHETEVHTREWDLNRLLDEQKVPVSEHDRISAALGSKLRNGERITIEHTTPFILTADGETKTLYTTGKTVQNALQEFQISLGDEDKISPALDAELDPNTPIKIVRVRKELQEETIPIDYETVTKNDSSLVKGKEMLVQEGKEGSKLVKKERVYEDGKLIAENVVDEKVQAERVDKIVRVGTKPPVTVLSSAAPNIDETTKNGVSFGYKQILNNVTLTAYSSGTASTGKSSDDPMYGVTYTGTHVTEGRTIAVDKSVIPLGWWVYIEGVGFRRAEDTGSGVKGDHIDVYYDSEDFASRFGMKRGYTVYVIGPKKPSEE